jgi:hypothetical protein
MFDEANNTWKIGTRANEVGISCFTCQHFISAIGQLHHPKIPDAFLDKFRNSFHSAQWDHSVSLEGKRVAVVGTGASAIQIIPEVAKIASHVEVYQRTPPYVLPKVLGSHYGWQIKLVKILPVLNTLYRGICFYLGEYFILHAIQGNWFCVWLVTFLAARNRRFAIRDKALRSALTPTDPLGGKRILHSNHYYTALGKTGVTAFYAVGGPLFSLGGSFVDEDTLGAAPWGCG